MVLNALARTAQASCIGPAGLLQSRLTMLVSAEELQELSQRRAFLELGADAHHGYKSTSVQR